MQQLADLVLPCDVGMSVISWEEASRLSPESGLFGPPSEVCADPDTYGVVMVDFGFAKLTSENKSVEFAFGGVGLERARDHDGRPRT